MSTSNRNNYLILALFSAFISIPTFFGIFYPKNPVPIYEVYRKSKVPKYPINYSEFIKYPQKLETYYAEHFGYRFTLLIYYRLSKYFLADSPLTTAMFGRDKEWIFYRSSTDGDIIGDFRNINQFSAEKLNHMAQQLLEKQKWLKEQGIEYLYVIAPSKHYIYPEKLPKHIYRLKKQNKIEQWVETLKQHPEINFIYLAPLLTKAKSSDLLYFRADTHWNELGANIAQFHIAKKIQSLLPNKFTPILHQTSSFKAIDYQGDLAQYMGLGDYFNEKRYIPNLDPCSLDYTPEKKSFNQTFSTQCLDNKLDALVFRDSYFSSLQPYLSTYFDESTYIWKRLSLEDLKEQVEIYHPTIVIEENVDRYIK